MKRSRGIRSSEFLGSAVAFAAGFVTGLYGIAKGADAAGLAALVAAVGAPFMWYARQRTRLKEKKGEDE